MTTNQILGLVLLAACLGGAALVWLWWAMRDRRYCTMMPDGNIIDHHGKIVRYGFALIERREIVEAEAFRWQIVDEAEWGDMILVLREPRP